jgi:hypothetical protein
MNAPQKEVLGQLRHQLAVTGNNGRLVVEILDEQGRPYHAPVRRVTRTRTNGQDVLTLHIDDAYVDDTPLTPTVSTKEPLDLDEYRR